MKFYLKMDKKVTFILLLSFIIPVCISQAQEILKDFPVLKGPYLGQTPPGRTPEKFATGIVSTESHEFSCCFSPDDNEFYFTRRNPELNQTVVMVSKRIHDVWTEAEMASFEQNGFSFEPFVTPDNRILYFQTGKVVDGAMHMFTQYVERNESGGWGMVADPGEIFNPSRTMHISAALDGTIFTTDISAGMGSEALGIIRMVDHKYKKLEKLGEPFNKEYQSMHPWIAPDKSYLIYTVRRPGQEPESVLHCSFRQENGSWGNPQEISMGMSAGQPFVTPDGKYLFFTSGERGKGDIYWVDAKVIEEIKYKRYDESHP